MLMRVLALASVTFALQSQAAFNAVTAGRHGSLNMPAVAMGNRVRPGTCDVRMLWKVKGGIGSGTLAPIGVFQTDGREGITTRSFKDPHEGFVVNTVVNFSFEYSKPEPRPYTIELGISISRQETDDILLTIDSSEASTPYDKNWDLSVTKNVLVDKVFYIYTLHCWDRSMPKRY
jgi:hypothetical protein